MFNIMHLHVMFRLVGGDASPHPPPKSTTARAIDKISGLIRILNVSSVLDSYTAKRHQNKFAKLSVDFI